MSKEKQDAIRRLERALALTEATPDWHLGYLIAQHNMLQHDEGTDEREDWGAIRDLIVIASHGAPETISYLDEEWHAIIGSVNRTRKP